MSIYLFIGPYVELRTSGKYPNCPADLMEEWDRLLEDHERLEWNFSRGSPPTVTVRGREMWSWCAIPIARRNNPPRWPMLLHPEHWGSGDFFSFDLLRSACEAEPGPLPHSSNGIGSPRLTRKNFSS
jgi:hypothetical protein